MKPGRRRKALLLFGKVAVSVGLLSYLILKVEWQQAATLLVNAHRTSVALAPTLYLAAFLFGAGRWQRVLSDNGIRLSLAQAYLGYMVGQFYSLVLPGVIGGDAIRIGRCVMRSRCAIGEATASVLVERAVGFIVLVGFFVFAPSSYLAQNASADSGSAWLARGLVSFGGAVLLGLLLLRKLWSRALARRRFGGFLARMVSASRVVGNLQTRSLGLVLIASALFQFCDIAVTYLLSQAMGLNIPLGSLFWIMPIVYIATILPVSLGGLGIRETVFTLLLSRFGISASEAVLLSFLIYLARAAVGIVGGGVQVAEFLFRAEWASPGEDGPERGEHLGSESNLPREDCVSDVEVRSADDLPPVV